LGPLWGLSALNKMVSEHSSQLPSPRHSTSAWQLPTAACCYHTGRCQITRSSRIAESRIARRCSSIRRDSPNHVPGSLLLRWPPSTALTARRTDGLPDSLLLRWAGGLPCRRDGRSGSCYVVLRVPRAPSFLCTLPLKNILLFPSFFPHPGLSDFKLFLGTTSWQLAWQDLTSPLPRSHSICGNRLEPSLPPREVRG
jgi:hypothetical protein